MGKTRVTVCGALGRMGAMVRQVLAERDDAALVGAVEWPQCPELGREIAPGVKLAASLKEAGPADVYIDFSTPQASLGHLDEAVGLGLPAVIGTTGLDGGQKARLAAAAGSIPVLWSPNMSVGVTVMTRIAAEMARLLGDGYDIEIVEAHHNRKKDAPSGTALQLYEAVAGGRKRVPGRDGLVGERPKDEIGVLSVRGGDIVGDHTVWFCGRGEQLELTHRAQSRECFAAGAVRAALWLAQQKPGLYKLGQVA